MEGVSAPGPDVEQPASKPAMTSTAAITEVLSRPMPASCFGSHGRPTSADYARGVGREDGPVGPAAPLRRQRREIPRHGENLDPSGMQTRSRWVTGLVYAVLVIFVIGIFLSSGLFSPGSMGDGAGLGSQLTAFLTSAPIRASPAGVRLSGPRTSAT